MKYLNIKKALLMQSFIVLKVVPLGVLLLKNSKILQPPISLQILNKSLINIIIIETLIFI